MTTSSAASQRAAPIERFTPPGRPFEMGERTALGHVVDRIKDMGICGGENIYCAKVEAALSEHPAIVGPPDGARLAAADVQRHVAGRLASFTAIASGLRDG